MMKKVKKDFVTGLFFLVFGGAYFASAFSIGSYKGYGGLNISSAFVPKMLGLFLIFLSAFLLFQTARTWAKLKAAGQEDRPGDARQGLFFKPGEVGSFLAVFLVLILYVALIEKIGFIIMSGLFLFAAIRILAPEGKCNLAVAGIVSVVAPILIYALFVYGLDMVLPEGILG